MPDSSSAPPADPELQALGRLVGTWEVSGEAEGTVRFEWAEGGFFLLQHLDLVHGGRRIRGIEVIGRPHGFGEEPGKEIRSRVYSYLDGFTLPYVYELAGDILTIWGGEKGSPARYRGVFSADGSTLSGGWTWPGGGYRTVSRRIDPVR